jgi:hypothetical protein
MSNTTPYEIFTYLKDDLKKMDNNHDFYLLYRSAIAFTECFIDTVKKSLVCESWNFLSSDDQYARDLRYIFVAHLDENKKPLIRLPSIQRLNDSAQKEIKQLLPLLDLP